MKIGILAVQGAFAEHKSKLEKLGARCVELRKKEDLDGGFDGLVLPGGESTVQGKLLRELEMFEPLKEKIQAGMPVLATCAGVILLADHLSNDGHVYRNHACDSKKKCLRQTAWQFSHHQGNERNRSGSHDIHSCPLY